MSGERKTRRREFQGESAIDARKEHIFSAGAVSATLVYLLGAALELMR